MVFSIYFCNQNKYSFFFLQKGVNQLLESLYSKYIDAVLEVLRMAIETIDFIEHEDWDAFVDRLMGN